MLEGDIDPTKMFTYIMFSTTYYHTEIAVKSYSDPFEILPRVRYHGDPIEILLKYKDQEGKDRQRQLLYYVSLIRACNKVLYQLVYIGKKCVFLKEPLYLINQ